MTRDIVLRFLSHKDTAGSYSEQLVDSMTALSAEFKETNEEVKFDVCVLLTDVISPSLNQVK